MKKYILNISVSLVFILFLGMTGNAQVAINTNGAAPNSSSMLDITSTSSGMLVPRMTSAQRSAIVSPATGLLVFQTNGAAPTPPGFYYYNGAAWTFMITQWSYSGSTIGFVGKVGIGIATPNASSMLDITSTNSGMLVPRMTSAQRSAIATPATGLLVFQTDGAAPTPPGFYYYNGAAWTFMLTQWTYSGSNIGFAGKVGIGIATPNASSMLDVTSTNSGMLIPRMTSAQRSAIATPATGLLVYQTDGAVPTPPGFYYYTSAAWRYLNTPWTYSAGNLGFVGSVGVNIAAPTRTLDVNGTARIGTNGTTITNIIKAAITQTVGSIPARSQVTVSFAVANAATTSAVVISPLNALPANGLIAFAHVSAVGTVQVVFANTGAASINITSNTYYIVVIQ